MADILDFNYNYYAARIELKVEVFSKEQAYSFLSSLGGIGGLSLQSIEPAGSGLRISDKGEGRSDGTRLVSLDTRQFSVGAGPSVSFPTYKTFREKILDKFFPLLRTIKLAHINMLDYLYFIDVPVERLKSSFWKKAIVPLPLLKNFVSSEKLNLASFDLHLKSQDKSDYLAFTIDPNASHDNKKYASFRFGLPDLRIPQKGKITTMINKFLKQRDARFIECHRKFLEPLLK